VWEEKLVVALGEVNGLGFTKEGLRCIARKSPATLVLMVVAVLLAPQCFGLTREFAQNAIPCVRGSLELIM